MDELEVNVEARIKTLDVQQGRHARDRYDPTTTRLMAEYIEHEHKISFGPADDATTVAAITKTLEAIHRTGEIVEISVTPITAPTGGDRAFTVDVKKSTGAGAFATILSSVVTVNSSSVSRTAQYATLSATAADLLLARGDMLQVVVAISGSSGTQGIGYVVTIRIRENPAA